MTRPNPDSVDIEKFYKHLDELSEIQKLGNKGHGDLEDNCYVCGISPSKHKQFIQALIDSAVTKARDEAITVNRFEVIDHTKDGIGRAYVRMLKDDFEVTLSRQDDDRTLKVFLGSTNTKGKDK